VKQSAEEEEQSLSAAETLSRNLDRPMGVLGILFLLVVLGQLLAEDTVLLSVFGWVAWILWSVFVAEFALRAYVARFQRRFWKRNWWQVIFLLVPFLRFIRALQALRFWRVARVARFGGVLSAGVRGSRSAGRLLSSRIAVLSAVTAIVILVSSQLLVITGAHDNYVDALYEAALLSTTGEPLSVDTGFSRLLEVILSIYSVAVFAALAGALGAFFLRGQSPYQVAAFGESPEHSDTTPRVD